MTSATPEPRGGKPKEGEEGYVSGIADGNLASPMVLKDFLYGIGVVFRLSKKAKEKRDAKAAAGEQKKVLGITLPRLPALPFNIAVMAKPLGALAIGVIALAAFRSLRGQDIPATAVGTWATQDGRYAGRSFWLNPHAVAFQTGVTTAQFTVHPIKRIRAQIKGDSTLLQVDYEQDGGPITLSVIIREQPTRVLRLANQPTVQWLRTGDAPAIKP
ncbi:MAG: hypothetical protein ABI647_09430 [Gemmatimonadota bacterium]